MTRPKSPRDVLLPSITKMCSAQETHVQCPPNSAIQLVKQQHANRVATGCSHTPPRTTEKSRCGHVHTNRTARLGVHPSPTSLDNKSKKRDRTQGLCSSCPGWKHQASPAATSTMRFRLCHLPHQRTLGDLRHGLE